MWNPFRKRITYITDQPVWVISKEAGCMVAEVRDVVPDGYVVYLPELLNAPTPYYWVPVGDAHERLRARTA